MKLRIKRGVLIDKILKSYLSNTDIPIEVSIKTICDYYLSKSKKEKIKDKKRSTKVQWSEKTRKKLEETVFYDNPNRV